MDHLGNYCFRNEKTEHDIALIYGRWEFTLHQPLGYSRAVIVLKDIPLGELNPTARSRAHERASRNPSEPRVADWYGASQEAALPPSLNSIKLFPRKFDEF